jgi:hypothetical protein
VGISILAEAAPPASPDDCKEKELLYDPSPVTSSGQTSNSLGSYSFCGAQSKSARQADVSPSQKSSEVCSDKLGSPMSFTAASTRQGATCQERDWAYVAVRSGNGALTYHAPPSIDDRTEQDSQTAGESAILEMATTPSVLGPPVVEIATLARPVPSPQLSPWPPGRVIRSEDEERQAFAEIRRAPVRVRPPAANLPDKTIEGAWAFWRRHPPVANREKPMPSPVMGSRTPIVGYRSPHSSCRSPVVLVETPQAPLLPSRHMQVAPCPSPVSGIRAHAAAQLRSPPTRFPRAHGSLGIGNATPMSSCLTQPHTESPRQAPGRILVDDFVLLQGRQTPSFSPSPTPSSTTECPPWLQVARRQRDAAKDEVHVASPPVRGPAHSWPATLGGA